jgi:DNA-binding response OmpR family regulator
LSPFSGLTILVLEDEPIVGLALEDLLREVGADVCLVHHNSDVPEVLQSNDFDLAILDVNVHGESSYEVAGKIRDRSIPIVFATGYGSVTHPLELAGCPTVTKPYSLEGLEAAAIEASPAAHSGA